ncbi:hypothetical protein JCM5353_003810, partial [Sporobolomyces roseus]
APDVFPDDDSSEDEDELFTGDGPETRLGNMSEEPPEKVFDPSIKFMTPDCLSTLAPRGLRALYGDPDRALYVEDVENNEDGSAIDFSFTTYLDAFQVVGSWGKSPIRKSSEGDDESDEELVNPNDLGAAPPRAPKLTPMALSDQISIRLPNWGREPDKKTKKLKCVQPHSTFFLGSSSQGKIFLVLQNVDCSPPTSKASETFRVPQTIGVEIVEYIKNLVDGNHE